MKLIPLMGCGVLLASLAGTCLAGGDQAATATTVPEILQVQHALRAKLDAPRGEYSRFDAEAVRKVEATQDQVFRMLDGVSSLDQLNQQQQVDLANKLELIKSTLLAQDGNRVICRVERKTGTNLTTRRCETVASRERNTAEARKYMTDHPSHIQQPEQGH
ncbi:hypothetical protein [Cognatiluteimonas profundi]|uniref:hypothetical protein n=1 Tax=Cognatiluteimonas profundi TaxID=2594501 RepID=UPI00131DEE13|nr:hypothetical protein [Lysobacter profundi]